MGLSYLFQDAQLHLGAKGKFTPPLTQQCRTHTLTYSKTVQCGLQPQADLGNEKQLTIQS